MSGSTCTTRLSRTAASTCCAVRRRRRRRRRPLDTEPHPASSSPSSAPSSSSSSSSALRCPTRATTTLTQPDAGRGATGGCGTCRLRWRRPAGAGRCCPGRCRCLSRCGRRRCRPRSPAHAQRPVPIKVWAPPLPPPPPPPPRSPASPRWHGPHSNPNSNFENARQCLERAVRRG